jgi:hypothetical protein
MDSFPGVTHSRQSTLFKVQARPAVCGLSHSSIGCFGGCAEQQGNTQALIVSSKNLERSALAEQEIRLHEHEVRARFAESKKSRGVPQCQGFTVFITGLKSSRTTA